MVRALKIASPAGLAVFALLAACEPVGPNYVRPEVAIPAQLTEAEPWQVGVPQDTIGRGDWWTVFNDPMLNNLQVEAVKQNPDLKAVAARVLQAQALAGISTSYLYPEINAGGLAQRYANNSNFVTLVPPSPITDNQPVITSAFKAVPLYATSLLSGNFAEGVGYRTDKEGENGF